MNKLQTDRIIILALAYAMVVLTGLFIFALLKFRKILQSTDSTFLFGMLCIAIFIVFKQAFTRADLHALIFLAMAPAMLTLASLATQHNTTPGRIVLG